MEKERYDRYDDEDESPPSFLSTSSDWRRNLPKKPLILGGAGALLVLLLIFTVFSGDDDRVEEQPSTAASMEVVERMQHRFERLEERVEQVEMQLTRLPGLVHQVENLASGGDTGRLDQLAAQLETLDENVGDLREETKALKNRQSRFSEALSERRTAERQPAPEPEATSTARYHEVQKGDTLYSIARNNNISLERLLEQNNLSADAVIQPGDRLIVRE